MIVMTNPMILITQTTMNGTRNGCHGKGNPPPLDEGDTSGRRGNMHINIYIVVENSGSCSTVGPSFSSSHLEFGIVAVDVQTHLFVQSETST